MTISKLELDSQTSISTLNTIRETAFILSNFKWREKRVNRQGSGSIGSVSTDKIPCSQLLPETGYPLGNIPIKLQKNTSTANPTHNDLTASATCRHKGNMFPQGNWASNPLLHAI